MKKIQKFFMLLMAFSLCQIASAQLLMKVYQGGRSTDFNVSLIDSIVWYDETVEFGQPEDLAFTYRVRDIADADKVMQKIYSSLNAINGDNWGFKPQLLVSGHPTMDTQATGWDADFCSQSYKADNGDLEVAWMRSYTAICRCNRFMVSLNDSKVESQIKTQYIAECRAIRGFFYLWLAQTFGRVPLYKTGEDWGTNPQMARASYTEMWDFIIDDFTAAAEVLDWQPRDGIYGRCTKGMALTYLGDAYMWKAYRCPGQMSQCIYKAKDVFKQILDSGQYELQECYSTNWDFPEYSDYSLSSAEHWNKESIWQQQLIGGSDYGYPNANNFIKWYVAPPYNGGWGALYLSWEWYANYESGDKRRDASCVTPDVPAWLLSQYGIEKSQYTAGINPWLLEALNSNNWNTFHFGTGEYAPSIWSAKFWRNASAQGDSFSYMMWSPTNIYYKRLPNVMLDYAECCFLTGDDAAGWEQIDILRNRAFGNLEIGNAEQENYSSSYVGHIKEVVQHYLKSEHDYHVGNGIEAYPIPWNTYLTQVVPAKEYYTARAKSNCRGLASSSPVWKVAVNEERRKEFNCEWSLYPDMVRSGYIEDHINTNYPKDRTSGEDLVNYPWTSRTFDFDPKKTVFPIPASEIKRNPLCDQNEGY